MGVTFLVDLFEITESFGLTCQARGGGLRGGVKQFLGPSLRSRKKSDYTSPRVSTFYTTAETKFGASCRGGGYGTSVTSVLEQRARHFIPKSTGINQEEVVPSRFD